MTDSHFPKRKENAESILNVSFVETYRCQMIRTAKQLTAFKWNFLPFYRCQFLETRSSPATNADSLSSKTTGETPV